MCIHINSLPDDSLLPIFDRIPLLDLLSLDRVCVRWASLFPSACARRRTLVLILGQTRVNDLPKGFNIPFNSIYEVSFDGHEPYYDLPVVERQASLTLPFLIFSSTSRDGFVGKKVFTQLDRLCNARYSGQVVTFLTDLFPNVDTLGVIHPSCDEDELNSVIGLVGVWSLKTLKLWLKTGHIDKEYGNTPDQHPVRTLLNSINQQFSLRRLTLDIDGEWSNTFTFPAESYSFITQLKVMKLHLGNYDGDNSIWDIAHRFDSTQLLNIGLGNCIYNAPMITALKRKFEFTTKVSQLYRERFFDTVELFAEFCGRYCSLTMLQMRWTRNTSFMQLMTNLAVLTQLTHLKLNIDFEQHPKDAFAVVDRVEGEQEPRRISLPQVKILHLLIMDKRSHNEFQSLSRRMFPSVEVIIVEDCSNSCFVCRHKINRHEQYDFQRDKRCHRGLIVSLKTNFANSPLRLYSKNGYGLAYVYWTNYVRTEEDNLL